MFRALKSCSYNTTTFGLNDGRDTRCSASILVSKAVPTV
jgi:hypothetical protein